MINFKDIKDLRYYTFVVVLMISFFLYSNITGWRWFGDTKKEEARPGKHYYRTHYFRHK